MFVILCLVRPWNWFGVLELAVNCAAFVVVVIVMGIVVVVDDGICRNYQKWRLQWRCS